MLVVDQMEKFVVRYKWGINSGSNGEDYGEICCMAVDQMGKSVVTYTGCRSSGEYCDEICW